MIARWLLATIHLLALGIGLGAIWMRARAFGMTLDTAGFRRLFAADTAWGIAALLWISTGLARAFGGFEKGTQYYMTNHAFWGKMALLAVVLMLEIVPMVTLIRWRVAKGRGVHIDSRRARMLGRVSYLQALLIVAMLALATAMARGMGVPAAASQ
jgi:putative membrane protein